MLLRPQINLLALLALSSFAQAHWFEDALNEVYRRQADNDAASSGTGASISSPADNASNSPNPSGSQSPTPTPSQTESITLSGTPSRSSTSSFPSSTASNSLSTSTGAVSTTTSAQVTLSTSSTTNVSKTIIRVTQVVTKDGEIITSVSESTSMVPSPTNPAELTDNNDSSGGGMSPKTKSTVIGVVVGIGGAILLAGLAVVAWRIWGRKKSSDEGDDLVDYGRRPDTGAEKTLHSSGGSSTSPFQKTLENYHNPDRRLNASSNF